MTVLASKYVLLHNSDDELQAMPAFITIKNAVIAKVEVVQIENYQLKLNELSNNSQIKLFDFSESFVSPAAINCHTHLALHFLRGFSLNKTIKKNIIENLFYAAEENLTYEDVYAFAKMGAYESLMNGTGLVWDHYYFGKAVAQAIKDVGLCGVISPTLQDISGPGCKNTENAISDTIDLTGTIWSENCIYAAFGPHATDTVSTNLWKRIHNYALTHNIPVHSHIAQTIEETQRCLERHNKNPLTYLQSLGILDSNIKSLLVHGIYINNAELSSVRENENCALVFCPYSQLIFQFPAHAIAWEQNKVKWFVATDCGASNDTMNPWSELRFIAGLPSLNSSNSAEFLNFMQSNDTHLSKKALDNFSDLKNKNNALLQKFQNPHLLLNRILKGPGSHHKAFTAGTISPGSLANICIWNRNHAAFWPPHNLARSLAFCDTSPALAGLMTRGKWIGALKNGYPQSPSELTNTIEFKQAHEEAEIRLANLISRTFQ